MKLFLSLQLINKFLKMIIAVVTNVPLFQHQIIIIFITFIGIVSFFALIAIFVNYSKK